MFKFAVLSTLLLAVSAKPGHLHGGVAPGLAAYSAPGIAAPAVALAGHGLAGHGYAAPVIAANGLAPHVVAAPALAYSSPAAIPSAVSHQYRVDVNHSPVVAPVAAHGAYSAPYVGHGFGYSAPYGYPGHLGYAGHVGYGGPLGYTAGHLGYTGAHLEHGW